jgi:hypothetical protein
MTTIIMTHPLSEYEARFVFASDAAGLTPESKITAFSIEGAPHKDFYDYISANFPITYGVFKERYMKTAKSATFRQENYVVTFEQFWNAYNDKVRSSKVKTQRAWDKLTQLDRLQAYNYIKKYERNRGSAEKKYATTYIADRLWDND